MSSSITAPADQSPADTAVTSPKSTKGKNRAPADEPMHEEHVDDDEDDEDDDDEGEEEEEDDDEEEEEDSLEAIDPSSIVSGGRRTRGVRVDYTSKEALEKAGLTNTDDDEEGEGEDEDIKMD